MKNSKKMWSLLLAMMLSLAVALNLAGCGEAAVAETNTEEVAETAEETVEETNEESSEEVTDEASEENDAEDADEAADDEEADADASEEVSMEATVLGEGETQFAFEVVDKEGNTTLFTINTDAATVGEALLAVDLIAGDDSEYGLYVKTVNGITADYDVDGTYWAFYIDGEYASTGVDSTEVNAGSTYSFKVE